MMSKVVPLIQELIRNKCVNTGAPDSGHEIRSATTLKKFFSNYGLDAEILESRPGRASLIVRIPGRDSGAPSLMFMGHMDVVPAVAEHWSSDPFSGDVRGGYVWGRGAVDMLNITASQAVGFAEAYAKYENFPGDLIFLAVADEEASGRLGARWLVENHWEKVKTDYCITEGGGFCIPGKKHPGIAVTIGEKGVLWVRLTARGVSSHGSLPYCSDNAAVKIAKAVYRLNAHKTRMILTEEYRDFIKHLDLGGVSRLALGNTVFLDAYLKSLYHRNAGLARHLHAISRMTFSPNVINAGQKLNVIPDEGIIEMDIRMVKGQNVEDAYREIHKALGDLASQFKIDVIDFFPSNVSPVETPLFDASQEILGGVYPEFRPVPNIFSGVTDARFFRMKGACVYGFTIFDREMTFSEYSRLLHGTDERISLKSLEYTCDYFFRLPEVFFRRIYSAENQHF